MHFLKYFIGITIIGSHLDIKQDSLICKAHRFI